MTELLQEPFAPPPPRISSRMFKIQRPHTTPRHHDNTIDTEASRRAGQKRTPSFRRMNSITVERRSFYQQNQRRCLLKTADVLHEVPRTLVW